MCGYYSSQGRHFSCQNETESKMTDYSEAQICSQIPWSYLGPWVKQPEFGLRLCHWLSSVILGKWLLSPWASVCPYVRQKEGFCFWYYAQADWIHPTFLQKANITLDKILKRVNKWRQILEQGLKSGRKEWPFHSFSLRASYSQHQAMIKLQHKTLRLSGLQNQRTTFRSTTDTGKKEGNPRLEKAKREGAPDSVHKLYPIWLTLEPCMHGTASKKTQR